MRSHYSRHLGFTLVELLVAATLFTIVAGITAQFLAGQSRATTLQKGADEATTAIRNALSLITWDIQNAGYRVTRSNLNPAIKATNNGANDSFVTRFLDESLATASAQQIRYSLGGTPVSLRRIQYPDGTSQIPLEQPTVASIVAMNLRFETRPNQFVSPTTTFTGKTCGTNTPVMKNGEIVNCIVPWQIKDIPERLVRKVIVQLLARSESRISSYQDPVATYQFADGSSYKTAPGFVYRFAEQVVLAPNLGR